MTTRLAAAVGTNDAHLAPMEDARGLEPIEAAERRLRYGPNELPQPRREGSAHRIGRLVLEPMAILLLAAAAVTWFGLGEPVDAVAILAIVSANVVIAFIQEGKATRALEALRKMESPAATVRRGGVVLRIAAAELVPGDVVLLAAGDRVPADARLFESHSLDVDESILTGESLPVTKDAASQPEGGAGVADQRAIVFSGTTVVRGAGTAVVFATGRATQLGAIAQRLEEREPQTPIQKELRATTARLGVISVVIAGAVFALTLLRLGATSSGIERAFLSAAALAVAAVPEGLPTVVTVALALGVKRMALAGAIVRRLPAVETLGSTTVILTDKTGTLTENRMRVDSVRVAGEPAAPLDGLAPALAEEVSVVLALNNDATRDPPTGDPMEIAFLEAVGAERAARIRAAYSRVDEVPFDSVRKRMTTVHVATTPGALATVKGAPETVVPLCSSALTARGEIPLTAESAQIVLDDAEETASRGARVLALARRKLESTGTDIENVEQGLTLVGLISLRDPIRAEARNAVSDAADAGLRILMVTGDHPKTALAVAEEVGLAVGAEAVTGAAMRAGGIPDEPLDFPVYARVDPDEKLALVDALHGRGHVVAVTGDGVNDAPALRRADIGVAMGRAGSDVAREAADMIVTDDNLATIVTAVREGRGIYDNIRKVVEYLVAGNLSEITVVVAGLLFFPGLGVPLLPLQLLWINLLTDGFPALALGVDPVDSGLMKRPPRPRGDQLLAGRRLGLLFTRALLIAGATLGSLAIARFVWDEPWPHARATMFSVLMTAHLLYAFAVRRPRAGGRPAPNRWLVAAVGGGLALQVLVVQLPILQPIMGTADLTAREWGLVVAAGALPVLVMMAGRAAVRRVREGEPWTS